MVHRDCPRQWEGCLRGGRRLDVIAREKEDVSDSRQVACDNVPSAKREEQCWKVAVATAERKAINLVSFQYLVLKTKDLVDNLERDCTIFDPTD